VTDRLPCLVPGCRRTLAPADPAHTEGLCAKHWPMADKRRRALLARVRRKARRLGWTPALIRLEARLWAICKAQAIERALGI